MYGMMKYTTQYICQTRSVYGVLDHLYTDSIVNRGKSKVVALRSLRNCVAKQRSSYNVCLGPNEKV